MATAAQHTSSTQELIIQRRAVTGRRPIRRRRREGFIPGVVYGKHVAPLAVEIERRQLIKLIHSATGEHALVRLRLQDGTPWEQAVLIHAVQHDPVDSEILHVDFHAIALTERLRVKVPILLKGEAAGVKQEGGILEHFLREVEIECLPTEIPASVECDVSALKIGDTIHVRDLAAPAGAKITSDLEGVITSIQKPREEKPEEVAAALTEPEVIREKKEEPAAGGEETKGEAAEGKAEGKEGKKEKL